MATSEIIAIVVGIVGLTTSVISIILAYQHAKNDAREKINKHKSLLDNDKQQKARQKPLVSH